MQKININKKYLILGAPFLAAFLLLGIIFPLQLFNITKLYKQQQDLMKRIVGIKKEATNLKFKEQQKEALRRQIMDLRARFILPNQISRFQAKVSYLAGENKVEILETGIGGKKNIQGKFYIYPLKLKVKASYHDLGKFFAALENSGYALELEELNLNYDQQGNLQAIIVLGVVIDENNS